MKTIQFVKTVMIGMLCAGMFSPTSCTKDETVQKSSEKELSNFRIAAGGEIFTGVVQPNGTTIQFVSPYGFDQEYLKTATPSFDLSKGATASPVSGKSQDFTKDVVYTVTAEDGSTAVYTVHKVDGTTSDAYFLEFSIYVVGDTYQGTIDDENSIIYFSPALNKWDDLEEDAVPTFTLAPGATASPESGVVQNFQQDVVYIVTAQDGTVREWTVKRTNRTGNAIDYFYLKPEGYDRIVGKIDAATHTVTIEYPVFGEDFTPAALTMYPEVIQISLGATVSPDWNVDCDFSQDVTYTVTAENGDQQEWTIIVPERYVQRKWKKDMQRDLNVPAGINDEQGQGVNSIGLIGDYLVLGRKTDLLIDKTDGSVAAGSWDVTGVGTVNGNHPPFFVANDDAGNLIGCTLGAWYSSEWSVFAWTAHDQAPTRILAYSPITGTYGRKLAAVGDVVNGPGKIITSESVLVEANVWTGTQHIWTVTGGVVNTTPVNVETGIRVNNNAYQMLTPVSLDADAGYYVATTHSGTSVPGGKDPLVSYSPNISATPVDIMGPFSTQLWNSWGTWAYFYHKLFSVGTDDFITVFTGNSSSGGVYEYRFCICQRNADGTLTFFAKDVFPHDPIPYGDDETRANGNATGSLTLEKVGADVFVYVMASNQAVVCYKMSDF